MAKSNKRQKTAHTNHHDNPNRARKTIVRRQYSQQNHMKQKSNTPGHTVQSGGVKANGVNHTSKQQKPVRIPFSKGDRVLLVGEGDFSFTASLAYNHTVSSITATCFDTEDGLEAKYPNAPKTIRQLNTNNLQRSDVSKDETLSMRNGHTVPSQWDGFSSTSSSESESDSHSAIESTRPNCEVSVLYGIDATLLSTSHKKRLRPCSPFSKIAFNFPHVGGLSTDVNRQVRANQELLVKFFNSAKPLLATKSNPVKLPTVYIDPDVYHTDEEQQDAGEEDQAPSEITDGHILVTLFEGEPYSLWNIRDLARHCGLQVVESFKFPWSAYPGYKHARTIGDITTGKDRSEEGKRKGAWRGEERESRCYVLALKDAEGQATPGQGVKRRNKEQDDDDSD